MLGHHFSQEFIYHVNNTGFFEYVTKGTISIKLSLKDENLGKRIIFFLNTV